MADSVHNFIVSLEAKAKRILKDADKKRRTEQRLEHEKQFVRTKSSSGSSKKMAQSGSILMPLVDSTNMGSSGKLPAGHPGNEKVLNAATLADTARNSKTQVMQYSVPKLSVSLTADTVDLDELAMSGTVRPTSAGGKTTLRPIAQETMSMASTVSSTGLETNGRKKRAATFDKSFLTRSVEVKTRPNKTLQKLDQSAYISTVNGEKPATLNEFMETGNKKKPSREGKQLMESSWSLKTHATDVLSGKQQGNVNAVQAKQAKAALAKRKAKIQEEPQGPVDWNIRGLRSKYRGEVERENLYLNWLMTNKYADSAADESGLILSVSKVERHPLYVAYQRVLEEENVRSFRRTRTRLRMKRFVLDVQEIWLTNLQHLREHQPALFLKESPEPVPMDAGLAGRRDQAAIKGMESQIQSVSEKRALQHAFFSAAMDEPAVVLNYEAGPTPSLLPPTPLPPVLESVIDGLSVTPMGQPQGHMDTHLLFVDRLLPSPQMTDRDVSWRISIMEKKTVASAAFYTDEATVVDFVSSARVVTAPSSSETPVRAHECDTQIRWSVMDLPSRIQIMLSYSSDNFRKIVVTVRATLGPEFESSILEIKTDVAELLSLYPERCAGVNTLGRMDWWAGPSASGVWEYVVDSLRIKEDEYNDEGDPYPKTVVFRRNRTVASGVEEAMETPEAFSLAFILCKFININSFKVHPDDECNALSISIDSVEGSIPPLASKHGEESYESVADNLPSLSYRVQGSIDRRAQVPGSCEFWYSDDVEDPSRPPYMQTEHSYHTKMGVWFDYRHDKERTRPCTSYFRDADLSTTNSVLMVMALALDTPVMVPTTTAWEAFTEMPEKCPGEVADGIVPFLNSLPKSICTEPLESPITERMSFMSAIFSTLPISGLDHIDIEEPSLPDGFIRHWPERNMYGFRRKVVNHLLGVDLILPTIVFGITRSGAIANYTGVTTRNIWHNVLAVVEHINRPRTAKDYAYILTNGFSRGANNPNAFTIIMKEGEFFDLYCQFLAKFEEEYAEINERKAIFARQVALDQKIEISEIALRTRERLLERQILKERQRAIEKKVRKATKSEKGWRRRMKMSVLVEVQKNWEKRKDYYSGAYFWHEILPTRYDADVIGEASVGDDVSIDDDMSSIGNSPLRQQKRRGEKGYGKKERYLQTCQWSVPATWDGDPLSDGTQAPTMANNMAGQDKYRSDNASQSGISLTGDSEVGYIPPDAFDGSSAFQEPKDTWVPGGDFSIIDAEKTPGIQSAKVLKRPTRESDREDLMSYNDDRPAGEPRKVVDFSQIAEGSFLESNAERATINTGNMEIIAEQLVKSDELIRILAKRLGLPVENLVPVDQMPSVFSSGGGDGSFDVVDPTTKTVQTLPPGAPLPAPRDAFEEDVQDPEYDSDEDLWSDDEFEAGDHDIDILGETPQGHEDVHKLKLEGIRKAKAKAGAVSEVPPNVPYLNLQEKISGLEAGANDTQATGWRRLARPDISSSFHAKLLLRRTIGPDSNTSNKPNNCIYLLPISPVDACEYVPENFETAIESIFIPDAKKDMERAIATLDRNIKREEELARNIPTDDLILFGQAKENTSQDMVIAKQYKQDQEAFKDPTDAAIDRAIQAAKASNITEMEDALEEDIPVNCSDQFGNTLLLLAAQQGSKRMCKFLLRKGANVNAQNLSGNTVLHFCFCYSHTELGQYLISKGADDSILNIDGMTCYEGLNAEALEDPYGEGF